MGRTPDRSHGVADEEGTVYESTAAATAEGEVRYVTPGRFSLFDAAGEYDPRTGGAAVDERVKVSANDTTPDYLIAKLVAGTGIALAELGDGGDETLQIENTSGAFGTEVVDVADDTRTSTTLATFQTKLTLSATGLPLGTYILLYQYVVTGTSASSATESRVIRDPGVLDEVLLLVNQRQVIASGSFANGGHHVFTALSGDIDVAIQWRKTGGPPSAESQIEWSHMTLWRIA